MNAPGERNESILMYSNLAKKLGWANWDDDDKIAAYKVVEKVKELQNSVGFISNIKDLGIKREELENKVFTQRHQVSAALLWILTRTRMHS